MRRRDRRTILTAGGARLVLHDGSLTLARLTIDHPTCGRLQATDVTLEAGGALSIPASVPATTTPAEEP